MTPKKILIVEDSKLLQKGYELLLRRYRNSGCEVVSALNGQEGLEKLTHHPDCDLIILDINMPVMGGIEFLKHLDRRPSLDNIPVIVSTTEKEDARIRVSLADRAAGFLRKPFEANKFHSLIEDLPQPGP